MSGKAAQMQAAGRDRAGWQTTLARLGRGPLRATRGGRGTEADPGNNSESGASPYPTREHEPAPGIRDANLHIRDAPVRQSTVAARALPGLDRAMTYRISRRFLLGSGLSVAAWAVAAPLEADPPVKSLRPRARAADLLKRIQPSAEDLIARANLNGAVGCVVLDAETGTLREAIGGDTALPPASVAKALTACYALETLGPEYRFETRVLATGPMEDGVLTGDLVLAGGGDPTLDTDGLARLAAELKATGLREVTGAFRVWGGALLQVPEIDTAQPDHVGYNPAVSGLNLNYNRVHFEWRRASDAYDVTMQARSDAHRPVVDMARMQVVARDAPVYTYADKGGRDEWTVARGALGDGGARWLPVRKPELYAGDVFRSLAQAQGITLGAPQPDAALPDGAALFAEIRSPALPEILQDMLRWSTNLTAEAVGLAATRVRRGASPVSLAESASEMNRWAAESLGVGGVALVDHSGLGERSRISAADMAQALYALRRRLPLKELLKPFSMRDDQGRPVQDHPLTVLAKTGTLNFVSGLAGYVDLPDGTELVFAIFSADLDRRAELSVEERERPPGGASWNRRAKKLQQALIERWGVLYTDTA